MLARLGRADPKLPKKARLAERPPYSRLMA